MPEGDTVFLAGHRLNAALSGTVLRSVDLRHPELATVDLANWTVLGVRSAGKHLFTRLRGPLDAGVRDQELSLHTHFRMDGSWHLYRPGERWKRAAHDARAILSTSDRVAVGFRLHDMELLPTADEQRLVGHLGPDLLGWEWSDADEDEAVRRFTAPPDREVGTTMLDQRVMAGVGNIYRTEACYCLGVTPWTPTSDVDARRAVRMCRKLLLRNAWHPEQSTTGELARGRQHWVYGRGGRACLRCGATVLAAVQGGGEPGHHDADRTTWYCPHCQHGPRPERAR